MKNKKARCNSTTSQLPALGDLLPNLEGVGSLWVSDLLVKMIVEMIFLAKTQETGHDHKGIMSKVDLELGSGVMRPNLLKVVARITQVSQCVKDGNNPAKLFQYVKAKLVYAAYKHGSVGRQLLDWADEYVKQDLMDCKAGTVFYCRRAA